MTRDERLIARLSGALGQGAASELADQAARAAGPETAGTVAELLDELEEASAKAAAAALEALPELRRRGALDAVVSWLDLGVALAGSSGATALRYFKESPLLLGLIEPPASRHAVLVQALELAEQDANLALEFLRRAPELLTAVPEAALGSWAEAAVELARWDYVLGFEFLRQSPALVRVLPLDEVRAWVGFGMKLVTQNSLGKTDYIGTLEFFRTSPALLGDLAEPAVRRAVISLGSLLADRDPAAGTAWLAEAPALARALPSEEWRLRVIRYGTLIAERDAGAALDYLRRCPEIVGLGGGPAGAAEAFETWFTGGMEVLEYSPEGARAYFALETRNALASVEQALSGVPLRQVARPLKLFVQALCGREVAIRSLPEPAEAGKGPVRPTVSADGRTLALPSLLRRYPTREDNVRLYHVMAAHEAGHLEFGTYALSLASLADLAGAVWRRAGVAAVEPSAPPRTLEQLFRLYPQPGVIRDLWTLLEDARVEHRLREEYPGLSRDLAALAREAVTTRSLLHGMSVRELLVDALLLRTTLGTEAPPPPEAVAEVIDRAWAIAERVFAPGMTAEDTVRLADRLYVFLDEALTSAGVEGPEGEGAGGADAGAGPKASEELSGRYRPITNWAYRGEMHADQVGAREVEEDSGAPQPAGSGEGEQDEGGLAGAAAEGSGRIGGTSRGHQAGGAVGAGGERPLSPIEQMLEVGDERREPVARADASGTEFLYDEWDGVIRDYRSAWCRVVEQRAAEGGAGFVEATLAAQGGAVRLLRRYFETIRPPGLRLVRGQADGEEVDLDALVTRTADRSAGADASDRIYVRREKREREVAAAFLVDLSGSTSRQIDPDGRRVVDVEKEGLVLLCEALEAVGDQYAVFGYSGRGRRQVDFLVLKDFDEPGRGRAAERIGAAAPLQQNRDGAAIRHATRRLLERNARVRLLLLLSDGKPLDDGYADEYSLEDTKMALREARMRGVDPFCLTVDREADDYLRRMYGDVRYLVIDRAAALPERLPRLYRRLTT